jgi:uncharacterized UPF0160 family protein
MKLITHNGYPHADDVLAFAVLKTLYPEYELIRTRDSSIIDSAESAKIVFDVGVKYDGIEYFDHHQSSKPMRDEKIPYSAFGLIWRHYGYDYLRALGITRADRVWQKIDQSLVRLVDIHDNGVICEDTDKASSEYSFLSLFTRAGKQSDEDFEFLGEYAARFLANECQRVADYYNSILEVKSAELVDGVILVFDKHLNNVSALQRHPEYEKILYTVMPRDDGSDHWQLNTVTEQRFVSRRLIAEVFAGKNEQEIASITGIQDVVFCHTGRFIAVGRTKESVLQVAMESLK